jgi:phosphotransacetylase
LKNQIQKRVSGVPFSMRVPTTVCRQDRANGLMVLDLDSGNTGCKLIQRLGGVQAFGPLLQSFAKPSGDLPRRAGAEQL